MLPLVIRLADLTKHAVCLGASGSGKTGLSVGVLEAIAWQGIPIVAVDPKGDIACKALVPRDLSAASFAGWTTDPEQAAATWASGLAQHHLGPEHLQAYRERVDVRVLTPGSETAPVDVISTLTTAPNGLDDEGLRHWIAGATAALLGLIGRPPPTRTDPAGLLLSRLLGDAFAAGRSLPLDQLVPLVVDPPFDQIGVFPLDTHYPRDQRLNLARDLNAVLASPGFAAWRVGEPLDVAAWFTPGKRTPVRVLTLAHLDDAERTFFLTLLLHAIVAWSRRQPGTSTLRALLYADEVMGLLPPHPANPPTKAPFLTLFKQARAVGLGVFLATQNPVDLDYKALSNAGTWLIGRQRTRQDRQRILDGLGIGAGPEADALHEQLANLPARTFVIRDDGGLRTHTSRHTLSFLRGPLTVGELRRLQPARPAAKPKPETSLTSPPPLPDGLSARFLRAPGLAALGLPVPPASPRWRPALYARFTVQFRATDLIHTETHHRLLWPADADAEPADTALDDAWLARARPDPDPGRYDPAPPWLAHPVDVSTLRSHLATHVRLHARHTTPEGRLLTPARGDVVLDGMALIWVPTAP